MEKEPGGKWLASDEMSRLLPVPAAKARQDCSQVCLAWKAP